MQIVFNFLEGDGKDREYSEKYFTSGCPDRSTFRYKEGEYGDLYMQLRRPKYTISKKTPN